MNDNRQDSQTPPTETKAPYVPDTSAEDIAKDDAKHNGEGQDAHRSNLPSHATGTHADQEDNATASRLEGPHRFGLHGRDNT